ncbi:MAG: hypothetical protein ABSC49_00165 [Candidatus Microgenomates bacterium]|jgi:hypothetical protein
MRRDLFIHFSFWIFFFVALSLVRGFLVLDYWPFWLGGLVGVILPDIDHLIYVFFMSPQDLTSQRVNFLLGKKEVGRAIELLYETRSERKGLIFHTIFFQVIFLALTFWLMSSSVSIFGKGLVLSFSLHLLVDQLIDLTELKNLDNWKGIFPVNFNFRQSETYFGVVIFLICIMGFLM